MPLAIACGRRWVDVARKLGTPASPAPILAIGAAVLFSLQLLRPIHDVDVFWQLKLGEMTLTRGLPTHEPFIAGKERDPFVPIAWLSQAVYAAIRLSGGWPLLRLVDAAVWFGGLALVARTAAKRCGNDWPALGALALAWYAAIPHASLRPQSFALLCFGALIVLVDRMRGREPAERFAAGDVAIAAALLVMWQNLHPSVAIGGAYLGVCAAVAWSQHVRRRTGRRRRELTVLAVCAGAATVLTPAATAIFRITRYNAELSRLRGVTEWHSMFAYGGTGWGREQAWLAFAVAGCLLVVAARRRVGRVADRIADDMTMIGLAVAAVVTHRLVIFWAVAAIPVVAGALTTSAAAAVPCHRWRTPAALVAVAAAILPPMLAAPARFADHFPFTAMDALKRSGFRGVVFCDFLWGGMLVDAGYPEWKITHDGRYYMFSPDEWTLYDAAIAGEVPLDDLVERFHPDAFVLRFGADDGLIDRLIDAWPVLFADTRAIAFTRPAPTAAAP